MMSSTNFANLFLLAERTCWWNFMMIEEVEHTRLKVRHFKQAQFWKWHFFDDYDVKTQKIKISRLVDPIKTHILGEH